MECLATTVENVWNEKLDKEVFRKVFKRLKRVLCLIKEDGRSNRLVESDKGLTADPLDFDNATPGNDEDDDDDDFVEN